MSLHSDTSWLPVNQSLLLLLFNVISREATNTNLIVFDLINHIQGEQSYYSTNEFLKNTELWHIKMVSQKVNIHVSEISQVLLSFNDWKLWQIIFSCILLLNKL